MIVARTLAVLAESEDRDAVDELHSYGVSFRRLPDDRRLVMAAVMLRAAIELQNELAPEEGWNTEEQGRYFRDLVAKLEHELGFSRSAS